MQRKILLADDSASIHRMVTRSIEGQQIALVTVTNGEDAAGQLDALQPDLVLADVCMPGKDGYQLCELVRGHAKLRNIPVVLLYGSFEPFSGPEAQRVGANACLAKPFAAMTLLSIILPLLEKAGATDAAGGNPNPPSPTGEGAVRGPRNGAAVQQPTANFEMRSSARSPQSAPLPTPSAAPYAAATIQRPAFERFAASAFAGDGAGVACRNHSGEPGVAYCVVCAGTFCLNCVVEVVGRRFCVFCKGAAVDHRYLIPELARSCKEANDALKYTITGLFWIPPYYGYKAFKKAEEAKSILASDPLMVGHGKVWVAMGIGILEVMSFLLRMAHVALGH